WLSIEPCFFHRVSGEFQFLDGSPWVTVMRSTRTKVGGYIGVEVARITPGYTKWHVYIQGKCSVSIINCRRDKSRKSIVTWCGLNLRQLINCPYPSTVQR